MQPPPQAPPSPLFVQDLLVALREARYSPAAWRRFLAQSWQRSLDDARRGPALISSVVRHTALLEILTLAALLWHWRRSPFSRRLRQAGCATLLLLLQQAYIALHLGMAQAEHGAPRQTTLGPANFLTALRGACATVLLVAGHRDLSLFGLALAIGGTTDVADGAVARWSAQQSRLGRMLDPMADVCFYGTAVLVAVQRGALPRWFGRLTLARFLAPTVVGFYRYFRWAQLLEARHTVWGKFAGILLTALLFMAILRPRAARRLCLPTSVVLTVAGVLQCARAFSASDQAADPSLGEQAR